jgi:hypothetical protein
MEASTIFGMEQSHFAFYLAKDYYLKGINAVKEVHPPEFKFHKDNHWAMSFPITVLSFSLELALKFFLTEIQIKELMRKKEGHSIFSLYNAIEPEVQAAIENHFEVCRSANYSFLKVRYTSKEEPLNYTGIKSPKERITEVLENANEAFTTFRYMHQEIKANKVYSFDFNTVIKLIHSCLAVRASQLGLDFKTGSS